jgi:uncharacterized protein (TIGR03435 family)
MIARGIALGLAALVCLESRAPAARAQGADAAALAFDVTSVKPNRSGDANMRLDMSPGRYVWRNATLKQLVGAAYQRQGFDDRDVLGGPKWFDTDRFDVEGRSDRPATDASGFPGPVFAMVRTMLADRFKLAVHEETRERSVYALVRARGDGQLGPRLRPLDIDCAEIMRQMTRGERPPVQPDGSLPCAVGRTPGHLIARGLTMQQLANVVKRSFGRTPGAVERPVIDRTGLSGYYFADLEFAEAPVAREPGAPAIAADSAPSIFTALQEQLGLRLEPTRGTVDVLVVDRAEPPTAD